jgi:hypothetical protein
MKIGDFIRYGVIVMSLAALAACNATLEGDRSTEIRPTDTKSKTEDIDVPADQDWVIFTNKQAEKMGLGAWLANSDSFWTPSEDDILILEEKLGGYLSQNISLFNYHEPVWERLGDYQRQYIGIQSDGSKIIYGNYFCDNHGKNWRQEFVSVLDGGNCYFQVEYDIQQGDFTMLMVNGES